MNCGGMMSPTKNPPDEQRIKSEYLIQGGNNQEVVLSKNEGTDFNFLLQTHIFHIVFSVSCLKCQHGKYGNSDV